MPLATTISTSSHRHRVQDYNSHSLQYQTYEGASDSTVSDSSQGAEYPAAGGPRYFLAEACRNPPQERCSRAKGAMSSHYPRRAYSDSKSKSRETHVKEPRVVDRDARRQSGSEYRRPHRRSEKEDGREGERVHVCRVHRKSEREADYSRPSTLLRSTTNAGGGGSTRHERQRTEDRELRRGHSERRSSHHEEKAHSTLRHEKRSIADHIPKNKDRTPVTR